MGHLRAAALGLAVSAVAMAQPNKPTQQQMQQAGELVKKAIAKSQAGDHQAAIDLYNQAYNVAPAALLYSNIGSEYQQLNKPVDALRYFCKYLEADPGGANASYATAQAKSLQIQLGNMVDDKDVCHPKTPPPPPPKGSDNDLTGTKGLGSSDGGGAKPGRTLEYVGGGVAVAGVVSLAIGITYAMKGKSLNDQINSHGSGSNWPDQIDGVPINMWDTQGHIWNKDAWIFSGIGAGLVVTGATVFYLGHRKNGHDSTSEHARITPVASPTGYGVAVVGQF